MEIISKNCQLIQFSDLSQMSDADQGLLKDAREAMEMAYAPYSEFLVGCALRLENGLIVKGNNQENMAYPSGLCAERVAIFYAGANYPHLAITDMAITARARNYAIQSPITSCGACLQCLCEYEMRFKRPIRTLLQAADGPVWLAEAGTQTFLPFQFHVPQLIK